MKKAIITGITGQDGSYLAELLLSKGYQVYGFVSRESIENPSEKFKNIAKIKNDLTLISVSITEILSLYKIIGKILPDEFYHLAAKSFVNYEMEDEISIMDVNFNSTLHILNVIKELVPACRFFFAGSSEMFGEPDCCPQNEKSSFNPRSIYGIAKIASYYLLKNFRAKENIFASIGIMYNHESPRRGPQFVVKKIVSSAVKIAYGEMEKLELGNLEARRDWGYAPDYVEAMWLILQQKKADDYIISTNKLHKVKDVVKIVFDYFGLDYKKYVVSNEKFFRKEEKINLCGDSQKIRNLGWKETKSFEKIIEEMIEEEVNLMGNK